MKQQTKTLSTSHFLRLFLLLVCISFWSNINAIAQSWKNQIRARTYSVSLNPLNPQSFYIGGVSRVIYKTTDGGRNWDTLIINFRNGSGWMSNILVHPKDTNIVIVGGAQFGAIRRSTDGGINWEIVLNDIQNITQNGDLMFIDNASNEDIFLARTRPNIIYRSRNRGKTWDSISDLSNNAFSLCTITQRSDSSNVLLAGCTEMKLFISRDTGKTWKQTRINNPVDSFLLDQSPPEIPKIVFSKTNPLHGYAVITYFEKFVSKAGGLYKTIDGGETWNQIAFPDTSLWSVSVAPMKNGEDEIVVGGFSGDLVVGQPIQIPGHSLVFRSKNSGLSWERISNLISWYGEKKDIWMIKHIDENARRRIVIASEAGAFTTDEILSNVNEEKSVIEESDNGISIRQFSDYLQISDLQNPQIRKNIHIFNALGKEVLTDYYHNFKEIPIASFSSGVYFLTINVHDKRNILMQFLKQ